MVRYANGRIPAGVLTTYAKGYDSNGYYEFQSTPQTWARYQAAKRYAERVFGRTIYIRSGWNIYRPYPVQVDARARECAKGNCNGAAYPGTSSHGGNWRGRDCLAIDVDPNGLSWPQVWEACRSAGFECGLITPEISGFRDGEPWHIIDFNAFGAMPAGGNEMEFDMPLTADEIKSIAVAVWNHAIQPQDANGNYVAGAFPARGFLSSAAAQALAGKTAAEAGLARDIPTEVWGKQLRAQDADGNYLTQTFPAYGFLANTNAEVTQLSTDGIKVNADIDVEALGTAIAAHVKPGASAAEVKAIVDAALGALVLASRP